ERLVVVCSEAHPRLNDEITAEQFFEEEHVVVSQWHSRKSLLNADDIVDLDKRKIKYRASGVLEMLPIICGSEYIGLMPESMINLFNNTYHVKSLSMPFD
ncbi:LysR family transcriptional regulator, partial [Vibrio parahaemolyticus]|nr:LysR family transcriptional regulator [Vibrio parahaemolyticus]